MGDDQIRLLACKNCRTIEEIPDYEGDPRGDHVLNYVLKRQHQPENGPAHIGSLAKVSAKEWKNPEYQAEIRKQFSMKLQGGETGLGSAFYDLKNTLTADALHCFSRHNRNPNCSDYKSESKRLTPDTAAERKEAGLPAYRSEQDRYLCEHCPVHSMVMTAARKKAGLYDA